MFIHDAEYEKGMRYAVPLVQFKMSNNCDLSCVTIGQLDYVNVYYNDLVEHQNRAI